jgi:uncharacterized protein (DUF488 family)
MRTLIVREEATLHAYTANGAAMTIFTIGYEGLKVERFLQLLTDHCIDTVVDVREMPLSRKPGFSKTALRSLLNLSGFDYVHVSAAGCPKEIRNRYRADGSWDAYTKSFLQYLEGQESVVLELTALAESSNCALLCFEADHNFCHRSMVARAMADKCNADIEHISVAFRPKTASPAQSQEVLA